MAPKMATRADKKTQQEKRAAQRQERQRRWYAKKREDDGFRRRRRGRACYQRLKVWLEQKRETEGYTSAKFPRQEYYATRAVRQGFRFADGSVRYAVEWPITLVKFEDLAGFPGPVNIVDVSNIEKANSIIRQLESRSDGDNNVAVIRNNNGDNGHDNNDRVLCPPTP